MSIRFICCLILSLSLTACSDGTGPRQPSDRQSPIGFTIVAATTDTLYYGERAWISVNDAGLDTSQLRLFIHTSPAQIDSISGNTIHFRIPRNASSGRIRLYKQDSLEAKGNFTQHVLPHHVDEFNPVVLDCYPLAGYQNEEVQLRIKNFPLRHREFELFLGNSKLEVLTWERDKIVTRVPINAQDGDLIVTAFDSIVFKSRFDVQEHGHNFLEKNTLRQVSFSCSNLLGRNIFRYKDSIADTSSWDHSGNFESTFALPLNVTRKDTIRANGEEQVSPYVLKNVTISLVPTKGLNEVSGNITLNIVLWNRGYYASYSQIFEVNKMRWKIQNGKYLLELRGVDIDKHLSTFTSISKDYNKHESTTFEHLESGSQARFTLEFSE